MKCLIVALSHIALAAVSLSAEPENPLRQWASSYQRFSSTGHPSISVTAFLKSSGDKRVLAFKLTNLSTNSLTISPFQLPWGNSYSITLAAFATDGQSVPNSYPIDDPPAQNQITIAPAQSLEGDYKLSNALDFTRAPKDKDIVVIWNYRSPLKSPQPTCTGVVVIPKSP
ncbi:MAG TPA: hypothetical protein VFT34_16660 [Verrucomicrobiae bacterium]|nr:hypothetical protein [Verrucomicrobiae bacterium]